MLGGVIGLSSDSNINRGWRGGFWSGRSLP